MSAGLEEIAQAVAVAVEDKALTQRIYEKCLEKFDGETNTLWQHLEADSKLKANGGWNKRIDAELGKGRKNATVKGIGNIDAAIRKFEKNLNTPLHLFWAFPQNWDKKTTPLVAFVPFDANPKTRTSIPAFDSKGNRVELGKDGAVAKQRPVLVLTYNERTQLDKKGHPALSLPQMSSVLPSDIPSIVTKKPGKGGEAKLNTAQTIVVKNFTIPSDFGLSDEWWEGQTEWIYTVKRQYMYTYPSPQPPQWGAYSNHYIGTWTPGSGYPVIALNHTHTITDQWAITLQVEFAYFEDDYTANAWDIFDDEYCRHPLTQNVQSDGWQAGGPYSVCNAVYEIQ